MTNINRPLELDKKHIPKHLPNTPQMKRLLKKGLSAHVFIDLKTLEEVTQAIFERGKYLGKIRKYERYGLYFTNVIGHRISPEDEKLNLYYGEMKINEDNQYHVIPRTKPSREELAIYRSLD